MFTESNGKFIFDVDLNIDNVNDLWSLRKKIIAKDRVIDLHSANVDSAGVAFLLALYAEFKRKNQSISFVNVPKHMISILSLSNLRHFLPIQE